MEIYTFSVELPSKMDQQFVTPMRLNAALTFDCQDLQYCCIWNFAAVGGAGSARLYWWHNWAPTLHSSDPWHGLA